MIGRLSFENLTKEQFDHIDKAQEELALAGITFDCGSMFDGDDKQTCRNWELDDSLVGNVALNVVIVSLSRKGKVTK